MMVVYYVVRMCLENNVYCPYFGTKKVVYNIHNNYNRCRSSLALMSFVLEKTCIDYRSRRPAYL